MIKTRKLFLTPILSILFVSWIPFAGIPLTIIIILYWYIRNQQKIHNYFRGINYEKTDITEETLDELK